MVQFVSRRARSGVERSCSTHIQLSIIPSIDDRLKILYDDDGSKVPKGVDGALSMLVEMIYEGIDVNK